MIGVYKITNTANGLVYVGASVRLIYRLREHQRKLAARTHENGRLQNAWNAYGADNFTFEIVEIVTDRAALLACEQSWIDRLGCAVRGQGYNIYAIAGSPTGYRHDEDSRAKMREAARTRPPASDETRAKLSAALKGRPKAKASVEKQRAAILGRRPSAEERAKMSAAGMGRKRSAESIERSAAAHRGRKRPEEARARMAAAARAKWADPEKRAQLIEARRKREETSA